MSTGHSYDATNAAILREVPKAVQAVFPIVEGDNEIRATNVTIGAADYSPLALNDHQNAREQGKSITVPVFADVELWRGGKRVQSRAKLKIGDLPLMTSLGSFMVGGNDYFVPFAQPRLKPGAYTREMNNGQYETFIPLVGGALSVWMDPAKGVLKVGHGDTNVSWYALVQAIGATDGQISQALGGDARAKELIEVNKIKNPEKDVEKFYISISRLKANKDLLKGGLIQQDERVTIPYADKVAAIKVWMESKSVDAFVTRKTMGTAISKVGIDLLLKAAHRILEVQRGAEDPDDRDAPEFKTYHGVEDLMSERIIKKARMITNKAKRKLADKDNSLADIFGTSWLNPLTVGYFGGAGGETGGLANTAEAANPLAILGERSKLTLQGEGGIQSTHAVTNSARLVRPTAANFVDLSHTPEGSSIGITTHAAWNAIRENKQLKSPFFAVRNGKVDRSKPIYLSIEEASDAVVGYPEYWDAEGKPTDKLVRANVDGEVAEVEPTRVQYMIPNGAAMFDHTSNAALFFHHTHSTRGMMAGKHISQALPLVHREEPLVKLMAPNQKQEVLEILAKSFTVRARVGGTVTKVTPTAIYVGTVKHELFDHYPMQAKVALHHDPVVKVGDVVKEGDLLADSNYSRNGRLALGVNLRSAYMPWRNATNYEDAVVISETAGKRLASLHMHRLDLEIDPTVLVDRNLFMAQFPTLLSSEKLAKLDESGVVKQGTKVSPGDIVITAVRKRVIDPYDKSAKNLGNIHKALERPYVNASVVWDEDFVGEVYRVIRRKDHIEIHIKTEEAMGVGDKISMGSAAKGTIAAIVPDDQMPHGKDGKPIEVIFNPHGVAGRINPSQTIEQAAGKLAVEGGERYAFTNFGGADHAAEIQAKLKAKGLTHGEMLFDPTEGRWLENPVATGYNYVFKLDHPVRKKFSARTREGYTLDEEPTRGKGKSGQSYDQLTEYALLGHNAHALLSESAGIRGTKNDDFWVAYQAGEVPPPPKVPFVFKKFQTFLHGMGIDTAQKGNTLHYLPMTDKRVREISKGAIQRASMLRSKDLAEEKGGLHDPTITGGLNGENYAHIELNRTLPHPLYEKVIRDVAGLKGADYYGLLGHTRHLDTKTGKLSDEPTASTVTGDAAFRHLLSFDIDQKLDETKAKLETAVGSDRNKYHRVTRYLRGLQTTGLTAPEAYLTSAALVIPPKYRPIIEMKNGGLRVADANLLYRDLLLARDTLDKAESGGDLPNSEMAKARLALYDTHAALIGVGKSLTDRRQDEEIKGFAEVIKGKNNKEGLFQRNLARRRNDYTGRSTIEPDATLGPDEIGIPKSMAWKIYSPMVVRRLVQQGWGPGDAVKELEKQTPAAEAALEAERVSRPVLYNRAPSLHRWNASTAMPRFVPGKEIKLSPLVLGPQNADFDGDTMSVTVPVTEAARKEAFGLLASKNLFYDKDRSLAFGVDKDVITGLFMLTRQGVNSGKSYETKQAALRAYQDNKDGLKMNSLVTIKGQSAPQQIGWLILAELIPAQYLSRISPPFDGAKLNALLTSIAEKDPTSYNNMARVIAQAGFAASARSGGITSTIDELVMDRTKIKRLLDALEAKIGAAKTMADKRKVAVETFEAETKPGIHAALAEHLHSIGLGGSIFLTSKPSSKLGFDSYMQMLASPVLVKDAHDRVVPVVIRGGYGRGMSASDYMLTTPGARAGMVAKSLATAMPGFLSKEIAGNMGTTRITVADCGTQKGIEMAVAAPAGVKNYDADILDRHLLRDVPGTPFKRNDVITPSMLATMRDHKVGDVWVRSAMTCEADAPPCQMCAGRRPDGKLHPIGGNIGYDYGQTIGERSTQLVLKVFHSGGALGAGDSLFSGFARLRELLSAPEIVRNQGAVADHDGRVSNIRVAPQGGYYVTVTPDKAGDTEPEHYVPTGRTLKVKVGDHVHNGDALSDGAYRPQDIAAKKGTLAAQQYVVDEARKAFQEAGAVMRRPVLEVMAASMMRYVEITNDGGEKDLAVGDVMHENEYMKRKAKNAKIQAVPTLPGISHLPLARSNDMMERLNFQRLTDTMRDVPAMGGSSDLTGSKSPIPGLAYGATFRPVPIQHEDSAFNRLG